MATEIEIKLAIRNGKALARALKRLGVKPANPKAPRMHEMNVIFDTPDGGLAKHGQLLRIRTESPDPVKKGSKSKVGGRTLLTFKSPPEALAIGDVGPSADRRHKVREEIETELTDGATMRRIFEGLGLRGWFRYEKYRTTYIVPGRHAWAKGLLIEVDETPIGTFVELEGRAEAIDRAAKELGYSARDYVLKNYLVLYLEDCKRRGEQPKDMVFGARK
ncbi:MAG TPA: class IV adenylate cyclase [Candidatus Limnocylindrales bacterium]|jgi:adenylate cyclase class 2|nr:class IV adenylate cyclase [Candidatus Limnocylindrales bacterium]